METETVAKMQKTDALRIVFDSIKVIGRLAPMLRRAPVEEERTYMLRRLRDDLEHIGKEGTLSLEFIGMLNASRFAKAFGIMPEKLSRSFISITYDNIRINTSDMYAAGYNINDGMALRWPGFDPENKDNAKLFIESLVNRIDSMLAD